MSKTVTTEYKNYVETLHNLTTYLWDIPGYPDIFEFADLIVKNEDKLDSIALLVRSNGKLNVSPTREHAAFFAYATPAFLIEFTSGFSIDSDDYTEEMSEEEIEVFFQETGGKIDSFFSLDTEYSASDLIVEILRQGAKLSEYDADARFLILPYLTDLSIFMQNTATFDWPVIKKRIKFIALINKLYLEVKDAE